MSLEREETAKPPVGAWRSFLWTWLISSAVVALWVVYLMSYEGWEPVGEPLISARFFVRFILASFAVGLLPASAIWMALRTSRIAGSKATVTDNQGVQPNERTVREKIMNDNQKRILKVAIGVVVTMLAFPPFYIRLQQGIVVSLGYGFVLDPPHYGDRTTWLGTVDVGLLLIQWIAVILIAGVLWWLAKDKV